MMYIRLLDSQSVETPYPGRLGVSSRLHRATRSKVVRSPYGVPTAALTSACAAEGVASADRATPPQLNHVFLGSIGSNVSNHFMAGFLSEQRKLTEMESGHPCGPAAGWYVNHETHRQFPAPCRQLQCGYCLPKEAKIRQIVLAESCPDTMWSQSMVAPASDGDPWMTVRYRMNLFFGFYRRKAVMRELCYTVEMNPQKTGYHIHALCHGPKWNMDVLRQAQAQAGLGLYGNHWDDIGSNRGAANYGLKGFRAAGYGVKGFDSGAAGKEALRINGGRLTHQTKGFIRVNGESVTMKVANKNAREKVYGKPTGDFTWSLHPLAEWQFEE